MATRVSFDDIKPGYFIQTDDYDDLVKYIDLFVDKFKHAIVSIHALGLFLDQATCVDAVVNLPALEPLELYAGGLLNKQEINLAFETITDEPQLGHLEKSGLTFITITDYLMQINVYNRFPKPVKTGPKILYDATAFKGCTYKCKNSFLNALFVSSYPQLKNYIKRGQMVAIKKELDHWCKLHNIVYDKTPVINLGNVVNWLADHTEFVVTIYNEAGMPLLNAGKTQISLMWKYNKWYLINDYIAMISKGRGRDRRNDIRHKRIETSVPNAQNPMLTKQVLSSRHKVCCYADFESYIENGIHNAAGFGFLCISKSKIFTKTAYSGENALDVFFEEIMDTYKQFQSNRVSTDDCMHCDKPITNELDETDEYKGTCFCHGYKGSFHYKCWMDKHNFMPIYFHNLKGYDSNLLLSKFVSYRSRKDIRLMGKSIERMEVMQYIGPRTRIKFGDTLSFLNASLAKLVSECKTFKFASETEGKGLFPYQWFDSLDKLDEPLPTDKKSWYNDLTKEEVDPAPALKKYYDMGFSTLREWHDYYVMLDTCQLADVFEEFREACLTELLVDPVYFQGAPSLAFHVAMRKAPSPFYLIDDVKIYEEVAHNVRGGVAQCCQRYSKVDAPNKSIKYFDVNGLYSYCMMQKLPNKLVKTLSREDTLKWLENRRSDSDTTLLINCNVIYPKELHDKHYQFPLCPHKFNERLCTTFYPKKNILLSLEHYDFLEQNGLRIYENHSYEFTHEYLFKDFVVDNNENRKKCTGSRNTLYKLLNNAVYGKTCENVWRYKKFDIIDENKEAHHDGTINTRLGQAVSWQQVTDDKILANIRINEHELNKPIHIGFAILERAKLCVEEFMVQMWEIFGDNARLLYHDTDSAMFEFVNEPDPIAKMKRHGMPIDYNKTKEPGLWGDEANGKVIIEMVGLAAKKYAYRTLDNEEVLRNKGVMKNARKINNDSPIGFNDYLTALTKQKPLYVNQTRIQSKKHVLSTLKQTRLALSINDEKRIICKNGINTLPWGYAGTQFAHLLPENVEANQLQASGDSDNMDVEESQ